MKFEKSELPDGWELVAVGEIADIVTGFTPSTKKSEFYGGDIPFVKPSDLNKQIFLFSAENFVTTLGSEQGRLIPEGAVLISCIGNLGKAAVLGCPAIFNQQINAIITHRHLIPLFVFYWSKILLPWMEENASATTVKILNKGRFSQAPLPLPPINEQKRIVAKIEALQQHSQKAKAALDAVGPLLEKFRQSVLAAAFRGDLTKAWRAENPDVEPASVLLERIRAERRVRWIEAETEKGRARAEARAAKAGKPWTEADDAKALTKERAKAEKKYKAPEPVDASELPELPEGWCWIALEEAAPGFRYGTSKKSQPEGRIPVLRMGNLQKGELNWESLVYTDDEEEIEKYDLTPGTVLFNRTNSPELVGKSSIYRGFRKAIFAGYLIQIECSEAMEPEFLNYVLNSSLGRSWCWDNKTDGVSQSNISASKLARFPLPVCSVKEQQLLVEMVKSRLEKASMVDSYKKNILAESVKLDQSILAKAFRGELVPQDPNDEPASVLLERIKAEREAAAPKKKTRRKRKSAP